MATPPAVVVKVQSAGDGAFDFVVGGVANEGVASADIEINVRQRFNAEIIADSVWLDLRREL